MQPRRRRSFNGPKDEWHLATSIWGPRARTCDSKDVWNTRACAQSLHVLNWRRALNHGLAKLIMKADDGGSDDGEGGDGDEVDEVWCYKVFVGIMELVRGGCAERHYCAMEPWSFRQHAF